ncbi:MAG: hypothetical protein MI861_28840, partial [Pirellulales bacterium]|nr:hypothetical protein [Pirellulales bacterium]
MAGQGSRHRTILPARLMKQACYRCVLWSVLIVVGVAASAEDVDIQLQLSWSADQTKSARVRVDLIDVGQNLSPALISEVENHCEAEVSTGAWSLAEQSRSLLFHPPAGVSSGAARFRLRAPRHAKLRVRGHDSDDQGHAVALEELLAGQPVGSANPVSDSSSGQIAWSIQRVSGDPLRIRLEQPSVCLTTADELSFSVQVHQLVGQASQALELRYALYRVGYDRVVADQSWPITIDAVGNSAAVEVKEKAPVNPGVYEIRCWLRRPDDKLWRRLRRRQPPLQYVAKPILVLPDKASNESESDDSRSWKTVGEIRPWQVAVWSVSQWLPAGTNRLIPGTDPPQDLEKDKHGGEDVSVIKPGGGFQATFPVMREGLPHRVTLRYPADRPMRLRVDVAGPRMLDNPDLSFLITNDHASIPSGDWASHTFVYFPRSKDQIRLTNLDASHPVAFESVVVQAGPEHLARSNHLGGGRRLAAFQVMTMDWVETLTGEIGRSQVTKICQPETIALYRLWIASDRLRDYAVAGGMNAVVIPVVSGGRTWFPCDAFAPQRAGHPLDRQSLGVFLSLMDRSDLKVFLGVDVSVPLAGVEQLIAKTPEPFLRGLRTNSGTAGSRYNVLHPAVQNAMVQLVDQASRQTIGHACFAGMTLQVGQSGHFQSLVQEEIDDSTLSLFAQSSSAESVSMVQLREWVSKQGQAAFEEWKTKRTGQLYETLAGRLDGKPLLLQGSSRDGLSIRATGVAPTSSFFTSRSFCRSPVGSLSERLRFQQSLPVVPGSGVVKQAGVVVNVCDLASTNLPKIPVIRDRTVGDISRVIGHLDPPMLVIQSPTITRGLSDDLAGLLNQFTTLPSTSLQDIQSVDPNPQVVQVRAGRRDGHLMVAMINQAPWPSQVDLDCSSEIKWRVAGENDSSSAASSQLTTDRGRTRVTLPAHRMIVLESEAAASAASISAWTCRVAGGQPAIDAIKKKVSTIVARLGILSEMKSYPVLSNGGFEQSGDVGLVGWLHAQHPVGAVRIDRQESTEGKHSVLLTTD